MELVYLWVEDYKNIHKQGFNFSPRFDCTFHDEYDENGKLKDNCKLKIIEKKEDEYIKSFFGDNINVTAIVGKNGSGKSSVLELISFLRFERISKITDKKVILIYCNKNKLYIICDTYGLLHDFECSIKVINNTTHNIMQKNISSNNLFALTMFTNGLYDFTMQDENYHILRTQHFYNFYNGDHIHYKERKDDKSKHYELNAKYAYLLKNKNSFFDFLDEKFLFDKMYLEIDLKREYDLSVYTEDEYSEEYKEITNFYNIDFGLEASWVSGERNEANESEKRKEVIYKFLSFYFLKEYIHVVTRFAHDIDSKFKEYFLKNFLDYIFIPLNQPEVRKEKTIIYLTILTLTKKYFKELTEVIKSIFKERQGFLDDFRDNSSLLKYVTKYVFFAHILEKNFILEDFDSHKKNFYLVSKNISIDYNLLRKYEKHVDKSTFLMDLYSSNILRWSFFSKNKKHNYRKLSTGEKQLLEFVVSFAYTIENMKYQNMSVIFIEEIEISMHPEWQKRLLDIIFKIFKKLDLLNHTSLKYNLIFTTHSPFLLSDIPKQNIIFLDKDENGNCKVVDGLKEKKQTFGANIHTLLSDSFFMEDGLMGEFAKGKIDEVINYLNGKKDTDIKTDDEAQKLVNIIGEPIVKNQLQRMLDSKRLSKVDKIDIIERQIKELQEELKKVQK